MTVNWGAVIQWLMIALGAQLLLGEKAAGAVLVVAGLLHAWGAYRSERAK